VFGNAPVEGTHATAVGLGSRFGVGVARGAAAPGDDRTEAVDALCAHRGVVVALGPCTNVAAALARGARWERLVVLGGTDRWLPNLRPLHTTELNFALDLAAAAAVLQSGVPLQLVPMEPCRQVWAGEAELARLPGWLRDGCRPWLGTARLRHPLGAGRFHPWDVLAAVAALGGEPSPFTWARRGVVLDRRVGRRGHVRYGLGGVEVVGEVEPGAVIEAWLARS